MTQRACRERRRTGNRRQQTFFCDEDYRAYLASRAGDWPWSSAAAHVTGQADAIEETAWLAERAAGWICTRGECLAREDCETVAPLLRRGETTGRPIGDAGFLAALGRLIGRDLTPTTRGLTPKSHRTGR